MTVNFQHRLGERLRRLSIAGGRRTIHRSSLAQLSEHVDHLCTRAVAVRNDPRGIAPVDAAACDKQVIAFATGDAAEFHFAPRRRSL